MSARLILTSCVLAAVALACPSLANAVDIQPSVVRPFDTRHRISLKLGVHNFFPDNEPHRGTKPDDDGVVTEDEWEYIFDEGYRIQDYDGATVELGYEYLFDRWFGLGIDMGIYGNERSYNVKVSDYDVKTYMKISVFHFDISPRFHWQARWTDLYGGPVLGYYSATVKYDIESRYGEFYGELHGDEQSAAIGFGLFIGFEYRLSKHFGMALEDRLVSAIIAEDPDDPESEPAQIGGNVLTITGKVHF